MIILSRGAEAVVYKKDDFVVKERVSKSYRYKALDMRLRQERTKKECSLLKKVSDLGVKVPKIMECKEFVIVLQYVEGISFKEWIEQKRDVNAYEKHLDRFAKFVATLHNNRIYHGDLTLKNVLITVDGELYLIDFGLGDFNARIEDIAMDLYVLEETSKHIEGFDFKEFLKKYASYSNNFEKIYERLNKIRARRRYVNAG